ncbi:MAG: HlyD family efflux transporter periplasmic adaptor subunit [Candidatus Aminicenantes bacterium]|nr:HlyD family efflux transporter periplasmic adaptor subunit [Candidatus Aminicenantes bacterium]
MKKRIILIALAIALLAILSAFLLRRPAGEDFVLKRIDVDYSILASCVVSFPKPYDMVAKAGGDVVAIPASEGLRVKKGTLLVQIDDFGERQNLAIALSNYEGVKLKMVNAREEVYPRLREQLNDASASLDEARSHAERIGSLYQAGAVSKVEWERAGTALDTAQARFNQVQLQIDSYKRSGASAELINQLNALSAQVELARRAVADKRVVAPYDATVVDLAVQRGEAVATGERVVTVLERKPWVLEANVDQKELNFLETRLPAVIVFDAFPSEKVKAVVSLVCSVIDLDKGTCGLRLQVEEERPFIKHGMTGSVAIRGKRRAGVNAGVLALPARYVLREDGGSYVLLRRGRGIEKTALEFTAIGEKWVSVRNLPEGARIALPE